MFFLAYHLHWGYDEIMALDSVERREFIQLLNQRLEKEQRAAERIERQGRG